MKEGNIKKVPFYSQIVNWDNENSGFPNRKEIEKWEDKCCGIACLRMVLDYYHWGGQKPLSYWELLNLGLEFNAHCDKGWIHQGLLNMGHFFGIQGQCHIQTDIEEVMNAIDRGSLCIVSVTGGFLGGITINGKLFPKGGHLVVAYNTVRENDNTIQIVCNHPSSSSYSTSWNKAAWKVDIERWRNSFSGNFIEFFPKSKSAYSDKIST